MKNQKKLQIKPQGRWELLSPSWNRRYAIGAAIPNLVTFFALFMGMSALRFGFLGQWQQAVASVLMAAFLDGVDGNLARLLGTSSDFGAELDSLADFLSFGVVSPLILYLHSLQFLGSAGWTLCLFFTACMAFRLARFNIHRLVKTHNAATVFSVGVPAPAGGLLILTPLISSFVGFPIAPWMTAFILVMIALLMVSRYPTFVFKRLAVHRRYVRIAWIGVLAVVAGLMSAPWLTLLLLCCIYIVSLPISGYYFYRSRDEGRQGWK